MKPTAIQERVELLDILRGIAIFGMFTVNMTADIWWSDTFAESDLSFIDSLSLVLVDLFTNGKFITIFSFLFGIGFYVQSERAIKRGQSVPAFWIRRLAGLLMIALIAEACTVPSWILIDYSLFGLGLLLFYRLPPRWILAAAIACFAPPKIMSAIHFFSTGQSEVAQQAGVTIIDALHGSIDGVFATGSFLAIGSTNLVHVWEEITEWTYYLGDLDLLGLMLLGLFVGRIGAVWNRDIQLAFAKRVAPWLLGIGFAGCVAWELMKQFGVGDDSPANQQFIANFLAWPVGMPVLGLGYAAAITILVTNPKWHRILAPAAPVGRMALTNFLLTKLLAAFLSFQWGLGLYGEIFPAVGLLIVFATCPLLLYGSRWWLAHFAYGPFEWLWRAWTYGQLPRMRLATA